MLQSAVGALELLVEGKGPCVVLAHPHPLYGGSMDEPLTSTVARSLAGEGFTAVRFNFRGVGRSEGAHHGTAEVDDLAAVVEWAHGRSKGPVGLLGYSFGGGICLLYLTRTPAEVGCAVLVAPPPESAEPTVPTLFIAGQRDRVIDLATLRSQAEGHQLLELAADHFFVLHRQAVATAAVGHFRTHLVSGNDAPGSS